MVQPNPRAPRAEAIAQDPLMLAWAESIVRVPWAWVMLTERIPWAWSEMATRILPAQSAKYPQVPSMRLLAAVLFPLKKWVFH